MPKIPIKCKGAGALPLADLHDFQGELKILTDDNYTKLKQEILGLGFSEPVSVWKDGKGKHHILNGHQRVKTVKRMVEKEKFTTDPLPVSFVEADSLKQAKEKVLALTSQYGTMTTEGLIAFAKSAGLNALSIERFNFPEISLPEFKLAFEEEKKKKGDPADPRTVEFDAYADAAIKMITLYFARKMYDGVIGKLDKLMEKWKLEDYSQVVLRLVNEAVRS